MAVAFSVLRLISIPVFILVLVLTPALALVVAAAAAALLIFLLEGVIRSPRIVTTVARLLDDIAVDAIRTSALHVDELVITSRAETCGLITWLDRVETFASALPSHVDLHAHCRQLDPRFLRRLFFA